MQMVTTRNLRPGMIVAQDIFPAEGGVNALIRKNTPLTTLMIKQLEERGIRFAYIGERRAANRTSRTAYATSVPSNTAPPPRNIYVQKAKPVIAPQLQRNALESLESFFSTASIASADVHASSMQIIKHLDTVVSQLVDSLVNDETALVNINDLKSYDEYTYHHSLSVAVLSIAISQYMGFDKNTLQRIGMCAMMHDIGKTSVPIEIIHKTSRLSDSEFTIVKTHSSAGFEYLSESCIEDEDICHGVLHHHEKYDGTGYPKGIKENEIPLWSRIISVADVYDALTSERPYRTPMYPAEAIEFIMGGIGSAFDYDTVAAFVHKVELYPIGSYIELSNNAVAVVINNESQMRPVARLVKTGEILDLYRDRNCLSIVVTRILPDYTPPR